MSRKSLVFALFFALAATLAVGRARAGADPLAETLEGVVKQQIEAFNAKNLTGAMATINTQSPEYKSTEDELATEFKTENLTATLVSFQYVGHDDEFAVARVKMKITAPSGEKFVDNSIDTMMLFHQQNGAWRIWGDYLIGAQTLE